MKNVLYMKVTNDEYELPVAIADTIPQLARITGVSKNTIFSAMSHARKHGYNSIYVRVDLEEDLWQE